MLSYSVYNCLSNRVLLFLNNGVRFDIFAVLLCHLRTAKILLLKTSLSCALIASEAGRVQLTVPNLHRFHRRLLLPLMSTCHLNPHFD